MEPRISLVTLGVRDLDASTRFYRDVLGLPQLETPPGVSFFELGRTWLSLYPRADLAADAGVPAEGSGFAGVTLAHPGGVGLEAEHGYLTNAAVAAGLDLGRRK